MNLVAGKRAPTGRPHVQALAAALLAMMAAGAAGAEVPQPGPARPPAERRACTTDMVALPPGTDLARAARTAAEGTHFCILAGEHRLQAIIPRRNQLFQGEAGAILNGARLLGGFAREGAYWSTAVRGWEGQIRTDVSCLEDRPRCGHPAAVFLDGVPLRHAASLRRLRAGEFLFDEMRGRLFLAADPAGRRVELSSSPYAFLGGASGVTIRGLVVEKYATPVQAGAIGYNVPSLGWTIEGNELRLNATLGLVAGSRSRVLANHIHDNGQMGAGCVGDDILFEGNDIATNGYFSGVDPEWEGGGAKCARTNRLQVRRNLLRRNNGPGFWTDIDNINSLYEHNQVEDNLRAGIAHEISYAAVIRHNTLLRNGDGFHPWLWGAAILIQNSRDVEVYGNTVVTNQGNGIALIQQDRGRGAFGPYRTQGNFVHDNRIVATRAQHGAWGSLADHDLAGLRAGGNRFDRNIYQVPSAGEDRWAWVDRFHGWDAFRARSGQEAGGTLVVTPVEAAAGPPARARR